jgi:Domain of unknown function (DUF4331)
MSHHFDTPTAREDPRICVNDFYLFDGAAGTTVMAMTVNADAGLSAPDTFRDEGLYAFRFDLNGDAREELTFKFRFGDPRHADGIEHRHVQDFQVRMASGEDALHGLGGELLVEGETGEFVGRSGIRAYAGLAPDLFAIDAEALHGFMTSFYKEQKYNPQAFVNRRNFFANRNVSAIVLEVPNRLIGEGTVRAWATASLVGHAPEVQVSRWGLPMITHIFLSDHSKGDLKEAFNRSLPCDDMAQFSEPIAAFVRNMTTYANTSGNPAEHGKRIAGVLCPATLPYKIGTFASFDYAGFNGRALGDDVMDVMLTLAANQALSDGVAPDRQRTRSDFPYFGEPYSHDEQHGLSPAAQPATK